VDFRDRDIGTWVVLMRRYQFQRLPRARRLLDRVEQGELLADNDIAYLKQAFHDTRETLSLLVSNPSYTFLFTRSVSLYSKIVERALENERTNGGGAGRR
jgi:hypothetical protein